MKIAFVLLYLGHFALIACSSDRGEESAPERLVYEGRTIIFRSSEGSATVALFLDEGAYRNYASVADVGKESDIGGRLEPCDGDITRCVEFSGHFIMVPPGDKTEWFFGGHDFRVYADPTRSGSSTIVASRQGEDIYSYSYSPGCGVDWVIFSPVIQEIFYPVGQSLFADRSCTTNLAV